MLNLLRASRLSQSLRVCLTRFVRCLCQVNSRASHHASYIINQQYTYQESDVTAILLDFSYENFHRGNRVPSWSLYSSAASSQYLKSIHNFTTTKLKRCITFNTSRARGNKTICGFPLQFLKVFRKL